MFFTATSSDVIVVAAHLKCAYFNWSAWVCMCVFIFNPLHFVCSISFKQIKAASSNLNNQCVRMLFADLLLSLLFFVIFLFICGSHCAARCYFVNKQEKEQIIYYVVCVCIVIAMWFWILASTEDYVQWNAVNFLISLPWKWQTMISRISHSNLNVILVEKSHKIAQHVHMCQHHEMDAILIGQYFSSNLLSSPE